MTPRFSWGQVETLVKGLWGFEWPQGVDGMPPSPLFPQVWPDLGEPGA